jgi:hypothetical protein
MEAGVLSLRPRRVCAVVLATTAVAASACRAVIGYHAMTYDGAPDGGTLDGACPTASPTVLFTTSMQLYGLFLGADYAYAEILNDSQPDLYEPYEGLVGCPKAGCSSPEVLENYAAIHYGVTWGSAAASDAGLFYSFPTASPDDSFTDAGEGYIVSGSPDGGGLKIVASGLGYPFLVTASAERVYWTDDPMSLTNTDAAANWTVKTALAGAGQQTPSLFIEGYWSVAFYLFSDSKNVYVLAGDNAGDVGLFLCPLLGEGSAGGCGGQATEFVSGLPFPADGDPVDYSFTADGQGLFRADLAEGRVTRYDLDTHLSTVLATGQSGPSNIAVDATDVYWSTQNGLIYRAPKDGAGAATPLVCGLSDVSGLAVDSKRVYFIATNAKGQTEVASVPLP